MIRSGRRRNPDSGIRGRHLRHECGVLEVLSIESKLSFRAKGAPNAFLRGPQRALLLFGVELGGGEPRNLLCLPMFWQRTLGKPHKRPSLLHKRPSLLHKRPSLLHKRPSLLHKRPSLLHKRPSLLHKRPSLLHKRLALKCSPFRNLRCCRVCKQHLIPAESNKCEFAPGKIHNTLRHGKRRDPDRDTRVRRDDTSDF